MSNKTAEEIGAEVGAEIAAEEQRLREAEQQVALSRARLPALKAIHTPLTGPMNGNGKAPSKPGRKPSV